MIYLKQYLFGGVIVKISEKIKPRSDINAERREFYKQRSAELTDQLENIRANFDFVTDPQAIDSLIYAENSVVCMLELLIREARQEGITIEPHERQKK